MKQGCVICLIVFSLVICDLQAAGNNGRIQIPGVGEYCANYYNARIYEDRFDVQSCVHCDGCRTCQFNRAPQCPWQCFSGCYGTWMGSVPNTWLTLIYQVECKAGCVETLSCNPPIANASHTGPGAVNNDPNSCPFNCNAGLYLSNGACVPCKTCDAGKWLQNCTGSDAGTCVSCTN
jgi:hypothetical protein